jgi:hypothetical protein
MLRFNCAEKNIFPRDWENLVFGMILSWFSILMVGVGITRTNGFGVSGERLKYQTDKTKEQTNNSRRDI